MKLPTFNSKITILNKLKGIDSATRLDVWKKTTLDSCFFNTQAVRNVNGTTVTVGNNSICRVPKNANYRPYNIWVEDLEGFTFSTGDYIIKGEVEEELITPDNIKKIISKYKPNAFEVRLFKDNTGRTIGLLEHYYLEGV